MNDVQDIVDGVIDKLTDELQPGEALEFVKKVDYFVGEITVDEVKKKAAQFPLILVLLQEGSIAPGGPRGAGTMVHHGYLLLCGRNLGGRNKAVTGGKGVYAMLDGARNALHHASLDSTLTGLGPVVIHEYKLEAAEGSLAIVSVYFTVDEYVDL